MILLNQNSKLPLYVQIYEAYKSDISKGVLEYKFKLPSIRVLASSLDVSVKTVQNAYDQLLMEGYIESYERSGFFVSKLDHAIFSSSKSKPVTISETMYINTGITKEAFDEKLWRKTINKVLSEIDLSTISVTNGETELKRQIIRFATEYRGIDAHYNQVLVGSSTQVLLSRLLELIDTPKVAFETPGYEKAEKVFRTSSEPIPVRASIDGLTASELREANMVYLSPSHQYPFGMIMPINERLKMLEWASNSNSYIIEDDYNSVLRYTGNPIPALQGLDKSDVVVYLGSFSNMLYPSINISYMILPVKLLANHEQTKENYNQTVSKLDQLTLAKYMEEGHFEKHLRKIKKQYAKKSEIIKRELANRGVKTVDSSAGTHIVLEVKNSAECIKRAKQFNVLLEEISQTYLLFRYKGLNDNEIEHIIQKVF